MAENQNQVIAPVIANEMDGVDVEAGGIYFERLPQLIQKMILKHLDFDTKKEFRLSPLRKFWKNDLIGVMVEFKYKDPESEETLLWVAKIINVKGYFVQLRYLSPQEELGMEENCIDFWDNLLKTDCTHSLGYNMDQALRFSPPPQILGSLLQHYGLAEDGQDHGAVPLQPVLNLFFARRMNVTDLVEVFDTEKNDILLVGVVTKIHGCRVLIEFQRAEKVQDVWCHHSSERFQVCGWATTVGYEVVVPPGLHFPYSPPSLPTSHMEMNEVLEFYTNLEVGMTLELLNPYKPSRIVAGKIARVLKWGNFIVRMNSNEVPAHGSAFVCRSVKSLDVFYSGFAIENGIALEAPFNNQNDGELIPVPKDLLEKTPLENPFKIDELLEAFDWWDFLLHPAKIVQVTGRLLKIRYLGFSPEMDQWVDVSSRDIYPMGWGSLS